MDLVTVACSIAGLALLAIVGFFVVWNILWVADAEAIKKQLRGNWTPE